MRVQQVVEERSCCLQQQADEPQSARHAEALLRVLSDAPNLLHVFRQQAAARTASAGKPTVKSLQQQQRGALQACYAKT
jgi:hypothetical protein